MSPDTVGLRHDEACGVGLTRLDCLERQLEAVGCRPLRSHNPIPAAVFADCHVAPIGTIIRVSILYRYSQGEIPTAYWWPCALAEND